MDGSLWHICWVTKCCWEKIFPSQLTFCHCTLFTRIIGIKYAECQNVRLFTSTDWVWTWTYLSSPLSVIEIVESWKWMTARRRAAPELNATRSDKLVFNQTLVQPPLLPPTVIDPSANRAVSSQAADTHRPEVPSLWVDLMSSFGRDFVVNCRWDRDVNITKISFWISQKHEANNTESI